MCITHNPPCPSSTQYNSNTVSCQDPGQSGEVRVAVRTLLKNPLIQLSLQVKQKEASSHTRRPLRLRQATAPLCQGTSLGWLLLENTRRGQDRWWCLEIQLRMFSHSAVPLGGGPSSLCSSTSCFWARTALPSNICSSCRRRKRRRRIKILNPINYQWSRAA